MKLENSPSETSSLYILLSSFKFSPLTTFCSFSRAFSATFLDSCNSFMILFNWTITRLGYSSWALDLVLSGWRLDIAFSGMDVFGVPYAGLVIFYDRFCGFPTEYSNCWSRISFRKKYLHKFLTEVRTLPWLKRTLYCISENQRWKWAITCKSHYDTQVSVCTTNS